MKTMIKTFIVISVYLIASMVLLNYLFGLVEKTSTEVKLLLAEFSAEQRCLRETAAARGGGDTVYYNVSSGCYG